MSGRYHAQRPKFSFWYLMQKIFEHSQNYFHQVPTKCTHKIISPQSPIFGQFWWQKDSGLVRSAGLKILAHPAEGRPGLSCWPRCPATSSPLPAGRWWSGSWSASAGHTPPSLPPCWGQGLFFLQNIKYKIVYIKYKIMK